VAVAWQLSAVRIRRHQPPLGGGRLPVILVDTSIWIDHLHATDARLVSLLSDDEIGCHHLVIEELALGSIKQRDVVLGLLSNLYQFPTVTHPEILHLVERRRLWGRGLSATDVNLLGSVALVEGARLWTRDKRLRAVCADVGVQVFAEQ
jgi:predicted nucleic acid-binding protein